MLGIIFQKMILDNEFWVINLILGLDIELKTILGLDRELQTLKAN